jgi:hypothetical protein
MTVIRIALPANLKDGLDIVSSSETNGLTPTYLRLTFRTRIALGRPTSGGAALATHENVYGQLFGQRGPAAREVQRPHSGGPQQN